MIHVRTTAHGPALGVTKGDRSVLCGKVTIYDPERSMSEPAATVETQGGHTTITLHEGFVAEVVG
jgi:hypothetical protein